MGQTTTIRVSKDTREELKKEKDYENETYDEIIRELILERQRRLKSKIEKAKERGDYHSLEEVKEEFNLE